MERTVYAPELVLAPVFAIAAVAVGAATDPPYVGKWKMNPTKSDFGQTTTTYEQLPSGEMQSTGPGSLYKFKLDGKEYPAVLERFRIPR